MWTVRHQSLTQLALEQTLKRGLGYNQLIYERMERAKARKGCPKGVTLA